MPCGADDRKGVDARAKPGMTIVRKLFGLARL
jgi:hypothetical protein